MTRDDGLAGRLARDFRRAGLEPADVGMLEYTEKLTRAPGTVEEGDVSRLRSLGFSDRAILDIVLVAGYYAFANRLAQGLGVPLEDFWEEQDNGGGLG